VRRSNCASDALVAPDHPSDIEPLTTVTDPASGVTDIEYVTTRRLGARCAR
jgi:hypothetical protein